MLLNVLIFLFFMFIKAIEACLRLILRDSLESTHKANPLDKFAKITAPESVLHIVMFSALHYFAFYYGHCNFNLSCVYINVGCWCRIKALHVIFIKISVTIL